MRAVIVCDPCGPVASVEADTWLDLAVRIQTALLACHATRPHVEHAGLRFELSPCDGKEGSVLRVKCLTAGCARGQALEMMLPIELVNAAVIAFHTSHEGHPLAIEYGEFRIESPT